MKIGQLVKSYIPNIFEYCKKEDPKELERLMDKEYSNKTFGINFPFCSDVYMALLDSKRYWKDKYILNTKALRVSSQWNIKHKTSFLTYLRSHGLISDAEYKEIDFKIQYEPSKANTRSTSNLAKSETEVSKLNPDKYFDNSLVKEADFMSAQYQIFYCLERSIRELIREKLKAEFGNNWWNNLDSVVKRNVETNMKYELDTTHTKRSEHKIDYTTFGDLRKIINSNWNIFELMFNRNLNSVNEVMIDLNRLRVPIAHCTPLADKEIKRLEIRIDDWYDLLKK